MTRGPRYVFLVTDTLLAAFDSTNQAHSLVNRELAQFSEQGFEPLYPYPALSELYNTVVKSKNVELRKRVNSVVGEVARSPLIKIPIAEDVVMGSMLANEAIDRGLSLLLSDLIIVAMALRMDSVIFTKNKQLSTLSLDVSNRDFLRRAEEVLLETETTLKKHRGG